MKPRATLELPLDMTPMIDVVFQLMIFFMVTMNMTQEAVLPDLVLPDSPHSTVQTVEERAQITIQVTDDGKCHLGSDVVSLNTLETTLRNAVRWRGADNVPVLIRGDRDARHDAIRKVMDRCSKAGIYRIRFAAHRDKPDGTKRY